MLVQDGVRRELLDPFMARDVASLDSVSRPLRPEVEKYLSGQADD